jgi:hypothetical protein
MVWSSRTGIVVIAFLSILGCAAPPSKVDQRIAGNQACQSFKVDFSTVVVPQTIGPLTMIENAITKEGGDLLVRYSKVEPSTSTLDVSVYPVCLPVYGSLAHMNEVEMSDVVRTLRTENPGAEVERLESFTGVRNGRRFEALKVKVEIVGEKRWTSFVYLAIKEDVYVKVRFTQSEGSGHEPMMDNLVAYLLSEFRFSNPEKHKHALVPALLAKPADTGRRNSLSLRALSTYGAFLSREIESGRFLDTLDRAYDCWEPTLRLLQEVRKRHPVEPIDSAFSGMMSARSAGYLREYLWVYFRKPYWIQPSRLRLDEFKLWASHELRGHIPCEVDRVVVLWKELQMPGRTREREDLEKYSL